MKKLTLLTVPVVLALAGCSAKVPPGPMAGNWSEVLPDGKHGMTLTFDGYSDKMSVHGRPQEDGTHTHPKATYTYDLKTKTLVVSGRILDGANADSWTGTVEGDHFELAGADTKLKFQKGGEPHGH